MSVRLSKTLSYLLRHGARKENIPISDQGFVLIPDLQNHLINHCGIHATVENIQKVVDFNDKKRFEIRNGQIRAVQGHSLNVDVELETLTLDTVPNVVVHGTYQKYVQSIRESGLNRMGRQHIHMAIGLPDNRQVVSGARKSADVFVYVDAAAAICDGIPFFRSKNNVILTPGEGDTGVLPPRYIKTIVMN
ncbi:hypothetical protein GEMRC1_011903 [Eukaryota sp. GEM-RC1]